MSNKAKILLVEDSEELAVSLRTHLESLGYHMSHADNGEDGLEMALSEAYDLIILDVDLPKRDGISVCRELRKAECGVPILMLTGKSSEIDEVLGLDSGADDYVSKPFALAKLVARIRSLLRRSGEIKSNAPSPGDSSGEVLSFPNLKIDAGTRKVILGETDIELTVMEFDLLFFLASRPGRAFSREEILKGVWESDFDYYRHAVSSMILRLRRKLEVNPAEPIYIRTVRGVGYRFTEPEELK